MMCGLSIRDWGSGHHGVCTRTSILCSSFSSRRGELGKTSTPRKLVSVTSATLTQLDARPLLANMLDLPDNIRILLPVFRKRVLLWIFPPRAMKVSKACGRIFECQSAFVQHQLDTCA